MKIVVDIEKLDNKTLKILAKDLGWNEEENLFDWLENNTKRFDCDIAIDGDCVLEEVICNLIDTYKGNEDIIEIVNKLPDDAFSEKDKKNLIEEACDNRRYKRAENVWQKVKETLEDFNDIATYKHDREYEVYQKEWNKGNRIDLNNIICSIDNEGTVLVEIKEE